MGNFATLKRLLIIVLFFCLAFSATPLSFLTYAHAEIDSEGPPTPPRVDVPKEVRQLLYRLYNSSIQMDQRDYVQLEILKSYNIQDVGEVVLDRLEHQLRFAFSGEFNELTFDIIMKLIDVAEKTTDMRNASQIDVNIKILVQVYERLHGYASMEGALNSQEWKMTHDYLVSMQLALDEIKTKNETRNLLLPNLSEKIEIPGKTRHATGTDLSVTQISEYRIVTLAEVERIISEVQKRLHGQPEFVAQFEKLEYSLFSQGYGRAAPHVMYFMGLPGAGKDHALREYITAKHNGDVTAYDKHVFSIESITNRHELWKFSGSAPGHVDSESMPPLIEFAVKHSGGRYKIEDTKDERGKVVSRKVVENPIWQPGMVLPGYFAPEDGFIQIGEHHRWIRFVNDMLLHKAIEKGQFDINNARGGLDKIYVPLNFQITSNLGTRLLASRNEDGTRYGNEPLTIQRINERQALYRNNPERLKQEILANKGSGDSMEAVGVSEEFLSRIPGENIALARALDSDALTLITEDNLRQTRQRYGNTRTGLGGIEINWSESLRDFIVNYKHNPEDNARGLIARANEVISRTIDESIKSRELINSNAKRIFIDVAENADQTRSLVFYNQETQTELFRRPIAITEVDRRNQPISDEEFARLAAIKDELNKRVFGIEFATEKVGTTVALSRESATFKRDSFDSHRKAEVFFALGWSGAGKTELGKALAKVIFPEGEAARVSIDFNNMHTAQRMREEIFGYKNGREVIKSKFMKEYDKNNGRLVIMLEEAANAPKEVLMMLYDILDESVVRGFSDGVERPMSEVVILMTGNASQEWYKDIPRDIPVAQQMAAMEEVYREAMGDLEFQRLILEKYFSDAFVNRVGINRFLFFPPLSFKAIRQITFAHIEKALNDLRPKDGAAGWEVGFKDKADLMRLVDTVEQEGFILREQGRSIVNFVADEFYKKVRWQLRSNNIPTGTKVIVVPTQQTPEEIGVRGFVTYELEIEGRAEPLTVELKAQPPRINLERPTVSIARTSFHEAMGHNLVEKYLLGDKFRAQKISRIPGVIRNGESFLQYRGIAVSELISDVNINYELIIEKMAVLMAGEAAESVVTKGGRHSAGIQNDIKVASAIAEDAILKLGLSKAWGYRHVEDKTSLTNSEKELVNNEVDRMLEEARALALYIIKLNESIGIELGIELFVKGELDRTFLEDFYKNRPLKYENISMADMIEKGKAVAATVSERQEKEGIDSRNHNEELVDHIQQRLPKEFESIESIVRRRKAQQVDTVEAPRGIPFIRINRTTASVNAVSTVNVVSAASVGGSCRSYFK